MADDNPKWRTRLAAMAGPDPKHVRVLLAQPQYAAEFPINADTKIPFRDMTDEQLMQTVEYIAAVDNAANDFLADWNAKYEVLDKIITTAMATKGGEEVLDRAHAEARAFMDSQGLVDTRTVADFAQYSKMVGFLNLQVDFNELLLPLLRAIGSVNIYGQAAERIMALTGANYRPDAA